MVNTQSSTQRGSHWFSIILGRRCDIRIQSASLQSTPRQQWQSAPSSATAVGSSSGEAQSGGAPSADAVRSGLPDARTGDATEHTPAPTLPRALGDVATERIQVLPGPQQPQQQTQQSLLQQSQSLPQAQAPQLLPRAQGYKEELEAYNRRLIRLYHERNEHWWLEQYRRRVQAMPHHLHIPSSPIRLHPATCPPEPKKPSQLLQLPRENDVAYIALYSEELQKLEAAKVNLQRQLQQQYQQHAQEVREETRQGLQQHTKPTLHQHELQLHRPYCDIQARRCA